MHREVYLSSTYDSSAVVCRYVRYRPEVAVFRIYEVNEKNQTIREYDTDGTSLPLDIRMEAIRVADQYFGQVRWPI